MGKNADPPQAGHVRPDMDRIQTLLGGVHRKDLGKHHGRPIKQHLFQRIFHQDLAHAPKGLGAKILCRVGILGEIEGIMPLDVERQCFHRLQIGQVMNLLQKQCSQHRVQLLGRPPGPLGEKGHHLPNRQRLEQMLPKQGSP